MAMARPKPLLAPVTRAVPPVLIRASRQNHRVGLSDESGMRRGSTQVGAPQPGGDMSASGSTVTGRDEFALLADPYRGELLAHCYRMLGSLHDAEDQVQETLLRAWRSYSEFEGRSSMRTWLHRIATNTCLRALAPRSRRPLPSGLGEAAGNADGP